MSYACFKIIYGLPLYSDENKRTVELEDFIEQYPSGLHTYYSGSAELTPACFGIKLDGFNECSDFINLSSLKLQPSAEQIKEYESLWSNLSKETQEMLEKQCGKPRVFFLTHTS